VIATSGKGVRFRSVGIPDEYTVTGSQADIFRHYGLTMEGLAKAASDILGRAVTAV
jgi:transketolase